MRKTTMLGKIIGAAASVLLAIGAHADDVSGPAPNFTLKSRDGGTVSLEDFAGDVVLINFWATWCGPCRKEMPHLEALHQRYKNLGFTLLGINVEDDTRGVEKFLKETPVSFPVLLDPANEVSGLYRVVAMPTTVIIDRNGQMRYIHHGYQSGYEHQYQAQIRELLRE
ncbi:MAG: TlpA family protein disulfide reductase [Gammaproteobacteria bacterium]|nr:TlpA family protein disulfide reductase [Gammaproteobacteria bacterium]